MSLALATATTFFPEPVAPDVFAVSTEDDAPLINFPSGKQQRLLTEPLFSSWPGPPPGDECGRRRFLVAANIGLFTTPKDPPIVPDVLLSLDVELHRDWWAKEHRSYFLWELGKSPDVVVEIASSLEGDELGSKRRRYAWMRIPYYVVWDPAGHLRGPLLHAFEMRDHVYAPIERAWFEAVGLGLVEWEGTYEGRQTAGCAGAQADGC